MLDYIKSCGMLRGNGMAYYIDGHDEYKFKLSNYKEKFDTIPGFRELVISTAQTLLKASIKETSNIQQQPEIEEEAVDEE